MRHNKRFLPAILLAISAASCIAKRIPPSEPPAIEPLMRETPAREGKSRKQSIRELIGAIRHGSDEERYEAGRMLEMEADPHLAFMLLDGLRGKNADVQYYSAKALLKLNDARAVPSLLEILSAPHPHRYDLVCILGDFNDARPEAFFLNLLNDDDPAFRAAAAEGLGKARAESALSALQRAAKDREAPVRKAAIWALGEIGTAAASDTLILALEDRADYVRAQAIAALGKVGEPAIPLIFNSIVFGNPDYRLECLESLIAMGQKAVPSLIGALENPDEVMKAYAIRALGNIGDRTAGPALVLALHDPSAIIRGDAANALRMLRYAEALPSLEELSRNDPNDFVRAASEAAVRYIRPM